jgi:hypothetical protein
MSSATTPTIVVAHARPLVFPLKGTAGTSVVVAKPSHRRLHDRESRRIFPRLFLRSQAIVSGGDEVEITVIAEYLKLLSDFLLDVPVLGIELAQPVFKGVNVTKLKLPLSVLRNDK